MLSGSGSGSDMLSGSESDMLSGSGSGSDMLSGSESDMLSGSGSGSDMLSGSGSDMLSGSGSDMLSGSGNNLHITESFYRPTPPPTPPPTPLPTLPPLGPEVKKHFDIIFCFSPAHPNYFCVSQYGCYTLFDSRMNIIKQTCIESSDFRFCLYPDQQFDGQYAECCYGYHRCNKYCPTPPPTLPPLDPEFKEGISCFSPAHPNNSCVSQYGCYTLFESLQILEQTCIKSSDFRFCVHPDELFDGEHAECCYGHHYCNEYRPPQPPTLPPLDPEFKDFGLICFSPAHPNDFCISQYGCYTRFESWKIINQTCIENSDFRLCLYPNRLFDGQYAECCYGYHYCNLRRDVSVATPCKYFFIHVHLP